MMSSRVRLLAALCWCFATSISALAANATHEEPRMSPLMDAAYRGDLAAVKRLVAQGINVNEKNAYGATALMMAAGGTPITSQTYDGSTEVLAYLIDHGAEVNVLGGNDTTALRFAVMHHNTDSVKLLLDHGADVNAGRGSGRTALAESVVREDPGIVQLLLDQGAAVNGYADSNGQTPLMLAVARYHPFPADLDQNASWVEVVRKSRPLMVQNEIVEMLLTHGAETYGVDHNGETTLTLAALGGRTSIVKTLVEHGAKINAPNRHGRTALMMAASDGNETLVKYLLKMAADVRLNDDSGETARQAAERRGHTEVALLLRQAEKE